MVEFLDEVGIDRFLEVVSVVVLDAVNVVAVEGSDEFALEREACVYPQLQLEFVEECVAENVVELVVEFRSLAVQNQSGMD